MANEGLARALSWLSGRRLTVAEVSARLERLGMSPEERDEVLSRLTDLGLVNDEAYARDLIQAARDRGPEGPLRLRARLQRRGLDEDLVKRTLAEAELDWSRIAERLAARYDVTDPRARVRLLRRMSREGFPAEVIRRLRENRGDGE